MTVASRPSVGTLLRDWRLRRRLTQLDLAPAADVSARHVSFVETGRSKPSAEMVIDRHCLSLHPDGIAPRITNLPEWRAQLLERLGRESIISGDPALAALHEELAAYPGGALDPSRGGRLRFAGLEQ